MNWPTISPRSDSGTTAATCRSPCSVTSSSSRSPTSKSCGPRAAARRRRQGLQAQARRRGLYAGDRHALSGRAHHRLHAGRTLRRASGEARQAGDVRANGEPIWRDGEDSAARLLARLSGGAARDSRIVDPACGSGAFLVAAFDLLAREYRGDRRTAGDARRGRSISIRSTRSSRRISTASIINAESVEITRLALWLKTARNRAPAAEPRSHHQGRQQPDRRMPTFDRPTVRLARRLSRGVRLGRLRRRDRQSALCADGADQAGQALSGDSITSSPTIAPTSTPISSSAASHLLKDGRAARLHLVLDLLSHRLGREAAGVSRTISVAIETVIDFGDLQVFEGVTTYPAIVTLRQGEAADDGTLSLP